MALRVPPTFLVFASWMELCCVTSSVPGSFQIAVQVGAAEGAGGAFKEEAQGVEVG